LCLSFFFAHRIRPATQFEVAQPPTDAISALAFAPGPASRRLLVSSWDKNVYLYEIASGAEEAKLIGTFEHRAPVLDVCFGSGPEEAFTAGLDHQVKRCVLTQLHTVVDQREKLILWATELILRPASRPS
jgi:cell cycle arrest protein BUB3